MSGRGRVRARGPGRRAGPVRDAVRGAGAVREGEPGRRAGPRRGQGRGVRMRGGGIQRAARTVVSDEIRATIIDHVINHGLSLREAGERVQPNLRRSTVASIIRIFQQTNR